ncbi:tRNA modification GTPase MSS1, mitochondrial [Cladophialophora carrionii]|uniref:tRNA modification GTPase MSS1, mitochondrial n=1 Tax=Cladophialophora carrionii TaxID=86049 RepID=A0A1C1C748_9EURO|nr:tRNA modification GTPase MSS1, mitochondrial [Cladophialophora carrionii]
MPCRLGLRGFGHSKLLLRPFACHHLRACGFTVVRSRGDRLPLRLQSTSALHHDLDRWRTSAANHPISDTIYALSTAPGRAAIAVIRISGPACLDIYQLLCPRRPPPKPRTATLRKLYDPGDSEQVEPRVLDTSALLLYFPAPNTVTGEDVLELHVHGGPAIVRSILNAISKHGPSSHGRGGAIRHAEPGEFTKWAFYNGRLDLTQAEALGETLAAETEQQRRLAVSGTDGGLAKRYEEWRTLLLYARGELEALIDFSEDQHFDESPAEFMASISQQVVALKRQIELHLQNASRGELLRNGISIALLGAPNAGKSSLLNRIVGREAAIVSAQEGTTRDIVDVSVDLNGWLCRLGDMAGLRSKQQSEVGSIEREGIRRARERALQSDVVVVLLSIELDPDRKPRVSINGEVLEAVQECHASGKTILVVLNKIDLVVDQLGANKEAARDLHTGVGQMFPFVPAGRICTISCKRTSDDPADSDADPGGIQAFLTVLTDAFTELTTASTGEVHDARLTAAEAQSYWTASLSVTHRQSTYLSEGLRHLDDFLSVACYPQHQLSQAQSYLHTESDGAMEFSHSSNHDAYHAGCHNGLDAPNIVSDPDAHVHAHADGVVDIVTAAEHLRFAADCLGKITGKGESGDVEDILGVVFEK